MRKARKLCLVAMVIGIVSVFSACGGSSGGGGGDSDGNGDENPAPVIGTAAIPAGCFDMGDAFNEGDAAELPVHNVCITAFEMAINEVSVAEYKACVKAGGCTPPADISSQTRPIYYGNATYDNFPVVNTDWNQANDFCAWADMRLPTEAEWEYAARGGLAGKRYSWGDTIDGTNANYYDSGDAWDNDTSPVGSFPANGYGLFDMIGNAAEWTSDWYDAAYYQFCVDNTIVNDPTGPAAGTYHVLRGGAYYSDTTQIRVARRIWGMLDNEFNHRIGFRCVK